MKGADNRGVRAAAERAGVPLFVLDRKEGSGTWERLFAYADEHGPRPDEVSEIAPRGDAGVVFDVIAPVDPEPERVAPTTVLPEGCTFGEALRYERVAASMTQREIGELFDVLQPTVSAWESDRVVPNEAHYEGLLSLFPLLETAPRPVSKVHGLGPRPGRDSEPEIEATPAPPAPEPPKETTMPVEASTAPKKKIYNLEPPDDADAVRRVVDTLQDVDVEALRYEADRLRYRLRLVEALIRASEES